MASFMEMCFSVRWLVSFYTPFHSPCAVHFLQGFHPILFPWAWTSNPSSHAPCTRSQDQSQYLRAPRRRLSFNRFVIVSSLTPRRKLNAISEKGCQTAPLTAILWIWSKSLFRSAFNCSHMWTHRWSTAFWKRCGMNMIPTTIAATLTGLT